MSMSSSCIRIQAHTYGHLQQYHIATKSAKSSKILIRS